MAEAQEEEERGVTEDHRLPVQLVLLRRRRPVRRQQVPVPDQHPLGQGHVLDQDISPHLVLDIFKAGADGILLGGCHLGDCHYISGNYYTEKRVRLMKKLLEEAGVEPERLRLEWVSASEGEKFSKVVSEFTEQVRKLGPTKVKTDANQRSKVAAADDASETFRLKALVGKEINLVQKGQRVRATSWTRRSSRR